MPKNRNRIKNLFGKYSVLFQDLRSVESRLDNLLLYVDFIQNKYNLPIILLQDHSVLILFELSGLDYECMDPQARGEHSYFLRTAIEQIDPGIVLTNYLIRCNAKVPKLQIFDETPQIIKYMQREKQEFWDDVAQESHENRIISALSCRQPIKKMVGRRSANPVSEVKYIEFFQSEIQELIEKLYENFMKVKSSLSRYGIRTLPKDKVFSILFEMLNQEAAPVYRPELTLNSQLAQSRIVFGKDYLTINENTFARVINIKFLPSETHAMFLRRFYSLGMKFVLKQIYEIFEFSSIEKKLNYNQNIAFSLANFDKKCDKYIQDVAEIKEKIVGEKQSCIYWNMTLYIFAETLDKLTENSYELKNLMKEIGSSGMTEVENMKFSFLSMLPGHEKINKRNRDAIILSANAGDLFSAFDLSRGDPDPVEYFLDRTNGIFCWNPFTSRENAWHMAITGPTGQGKSFFANRMVLSSLVFQPFIYIIDLSRSFLELFELLSSEIEEEAKILTFSKDKVEFSMNPFIVDSDEVGEEQLSYCESLISLMCGPKIVNDTNKIIIRESLEQFFYEYKSLLVNCKGAPVPPLDLLIPIIEQHSKNDDITNKLKLWTLGNKGKLINTGIDNLQLARFCYFDIQNIDKDSEELKLIVFCLFAKIMKDISKPENQNVRKFLVLDEAHHYLNIPEFEYQIDRMIRTGRHHNILLAILTQSINDLISDRNYSKGIINNLKQAFFFGGQKDIDDAFRMMQMDDFNIETYNNLNTSRREVLYWSSGGIRRILVPISDNFTYWLATTHPNERYFRRIIRDRICNGNIKDTVESIIETVVGSKTQEEKEKRLKDFIECNAVSLEGNKEESYEEN